jgi:hypothetical protein
MPRDSHRVSFSHRAPGLRAVLAERPDQPLSGSATCNGAPSGTRRPDDRRPVAGCPIIAFDDDLFRAFPMLFGSPARDA